MSWAMAVYRLHLRFCRVNSLVNVLQNLPSLSVNLCLTSTECTRFITHLSFETDVGAHTERRECAECVWGVQNTTTCAGRWICTKVDQFNIALTRRLIWWVQHGIFGSRLYPPSITMTKEFTREYAIQTEQELASSIESHHVWGGEDGVQGGTCMQEGHMHVHERNHMWEGTSTVGCCGSGGCYYFLYFLPSPHQLTYLLTAYSNGQNKRVLMTFMHHVVLTRLEDPTIFHTRMSKQLVACKLDDDLNFPPPSLLLSTHLPAVKISCVVLDLTKCMDTNVQGKVNKIHASADYLSVKGFCQGSGVMTVVMKAGMDEVPPHPSVNELGEGRMFIFGVHTERREGMLPCSRCMREARRLWGERWTCMVEVDQSMNGVRTFAVGTLGGGERVCMERVQCGGLAHEGDVMWGGMSPSAGVDGGCLIEGGVTWRVLWLWSADSRFSRELVETGNFTEVKGPGYTLYLSGRFTFDFAGKIG
ncbi:hypothetical protein ARMGADRAFT_1037798 [Armillaria gallica]|uniref:Uncharacterized protein n=1 Tax=Armillaria gallica TaxID=47427 RepID=A0A2H3CWR3_ARMGA|nr:hypothetical protein ARMGADRAFT_1037798 [Armillaria gallica]